MADSLILMVMALVVFGPRRLPQIGRQIGKLMYEFRKASNDFKFQMEEELRLSEEADRRKKEEERQRPWQLWPQRVRSPLPPAAGQRPRIALSRAKASIPTSYPPNRQATTKSRSTHPAAFHRRNRRRRSPDRFRASLGASTESAGRSSPSGTTRTRSGIEPLTDPRRH